jgi:hypothetical protein
MVIEPTSSLAAPRERLECLPLAPSTVSSEVHCETVFTSGFKWQPYDAPTP